MLGTPEDRRASQPATGEKAPGPATSSLAQEQAEWTTGEACLAPCSPEGALAQKVPCAEASLGGDTGTGLRPRAEVRFGDTLCHRKESEVPPCLLLATLWSPSAGSLLWAGLCIRLFATLFPQISLPLKLPSISFPHPHRLDPHLGHCPLLLPGDPFIVAGADLPVCSPSPSLPSLSRLLSPLLQKEDMAELGVCPVNSLADQGRSSDLSDIQEEEEEEEEELGSRTCSFQKQVAGNSIRENGPKVTG